MTLDLLRRPSPNPLRRPIRQARGGGGLRAAALGLLVIAPAIGWPAPVAAQAPVPTAVSFFGFEMGADGHLASWPQIQQYFEQVAAASDRVQLAEVGPTTEGRRIIAAIVSAPDNIARLDAIKAANRRLSDPRLLSADEAKSLIADQKIVLAIGASIHASEMGATQTASELLHQLATSTDPKVLAILRDVVVILIPSLNPDGHQLVVDWHERTKGTAFDGSPMPWLSHKYAGHDLNRDGFMLNMSENRSLTRFFYSEWHPQVFLTMHQMGTTGPRFFVPPNYEPLDANYDPLIWREAALLGQAMALSLETSNRSGVISHALYDYYWPGYEDSAPLGHNVVCLLTEAASALGASPIRVEPGELAGAMRGLPQYRAQTNFPNPWPGGTWRLRDIVNYELDAAWGLLGAAARYRQEIVGNFYAMGARAVERGSVGGPFAFIIPPEQHDPTAVAKLLDLLVTSGVEVHQALEPFRADGDPYPAGTTVILLAQPYRAYVKTLLEPQRYPVRRSGPGGMPERPYDATGWTLQYQMAIDVREIERTFEPPAMSRIDRAVIPQAQIWGEQRRPSFYVIDARGNGGTLAASRLLAAGVPVQWLTAPASIEGYDYAPGALVVAASKDTTPVVERITATLGLRAVGLRGKVTTPVAPLAQARVALYRPWSENIDEGWTRWLLEQYELPYQTVRDGDLRQGSLRGRFDVLIIPDETRDRLLAGNLAGTVPPEYTGGLGDEGAAAIMAFVNEGGTLVCLGAAGELGIHLFGLPVRDVTRDVPPDRFSCPGSLLRLDVEAGQPLAFGMVARSAAFFADSAAYEVVTPTAPAAASDVRVVARYGQGNPLMSGWLEGADVIAGRAAVIDARRGTGRVVLIGFRAQHRGESYATFRFIFNALLGAR